MLAQFLASRTNKRTDAYGGSLVNRMRLLIEIAKQIRDETSPSFIVGVKLNSVEFQDGGFTVEEAAQVCRELQDVGMDFVELSGGTLEKIGHEWTKDTTQEREAFFLKFAEMIVPQMGKTAAERRTKVFITCGLRTISECYCQSTSYCGCHWYCSPSRAGALDCQRFPPWEGFRSYPTS